MNIILLILISLLTIGWLPLIFLLILILMLVCTLIYFDEFIEIDIIVTDEFPLVIKHMKTCTNTKAHEFDFA